MSAIKFQDIRAHFSASRHVKQFIKRCDYALLLELKDGIDTAISAWEEELKKEEENNKIREQKRNELLALISSEGFTPEELSGIIDNSKGKRKMKYQYNDGGKLKKWSGIGRIPKAIQEQLNAGLTLDDLLIK